MYNQKPKRTTMRDRERSDEDRPRWVRGKDATPKEIGQADDIAWAIAEELEQFFYDQGINAKPAAWLFKRGAAALDKSKVRQAYSDHPERFRDGDGRQLTLAQFGRNMVKYFRRKSDWQFCSNVDEVIGMFYDPVTLDDCARSLWRVYRDRRTKRGID